MQQEGFPKSGLPTPPPLPPPISVTGVNPPPPSSPQPPPPIPSLPTPSCQALPNNTPPASIVNSPQISSKPSPPSISGLPEIPVIEPIQEDSVSISALPLIPDIPSTHVKQEKTNLEALPPIPKCKAELEEDIPVNDSILATTVGESIPIIRPVEIESSNPFATLGRDVSSAASEPIDNLDSLLSYGKAERLTVTHTPTKPADLNDGKRGSKAAGIIGGTLIEKEVLNTDFHPGKAPSQVISGVEVDMPTLPPSNPLEDSEESMAKNESPKGNGPREQAIEGFVEPKRRWLPEIGAVLVVISVFLPYFDGHLGWEAFKELPTLWNDVRADWEWGAEALKEVGWAVMFATIPIIYLALALISSTLNEMKISNALIALLHTLFLAMMIVIPLFFGKTDINGLVGSWGNGMILGSVAGLLYWIRI